MIFGRSIIMKAEKKLFTNPALVYGNCEKDVEGFIKFEESLDKQPRVE